MQIEDFFNPQPDVLLPVHGNDEISHQTTKFTVNTFKFIYNTCYRIKHYYFIFICKQRIKILISENNLQQGIMLTKPFDQIFNFKSNNPPSIAEKAVLIIVFMRVQGCNITLPELAIL